MNRLKSMRLRRVAAEVSMDAILLKLPYMNRSWLYNIELGARKATDAEAKVIAKALGCTVEDLKEEAKIVRA
jgi:hypothetical protein